MGLHTRKEFYELAGVDKGYLNTYIRRGTVILTGTRIDDSLPENKYFLEKRGVAVGPKKGKGVVKKPVKPASKTDVLEAEDDVEKDIKKNKEKQTRFDLELERGKLDLLQKQEALEILRIKKAKLMGEVVPTDLVTILFATHSKSITTEFHQAAENLLTTIAKQQKLSIEKVAIIRGELIKIINKAIIEGNKTSKKALGRLVREYSQKRGKGEK